jgi:hypothetical protein
VLQKLGARNYNESCSSNASLMQAISYSQG